MKHKKKNKNNVELGSATARDWLDALDAMIDEEGSEAAALLLRHLNDHAYELGVREPFPVNTPYQNSIPVENQPHFPGDRDMERINKSIIRWNAMAMVVRANRETDGIGGHISSYASAATLYEVGFNHFFHAKTQDYGGDQIYFQGHVAPGIYARAFIEGRLSEQQLVNFRRELSEEGGLPSYPHPWLLPDFWQFPTVSMGLGPITAIYQARFNRYLENRGLKPKDGGRVWAFLGDGETDEPETLGAIGLAAREHLNNLIFVVNCNLQRLDGPVRGNSKVIQELEAIFRGAGWNVIKVIWGSGWDKIFEKDNEGHLRRLLSRYVDGDYQKFSVSSGDWIRKKMIADEPRIEALLSDLSDEDLRKIKRGGHDPWKVYSAYHAATHNEDSPTVVLAKTVKGYGLGEAGEGKNITHQQKKLNEDELWEFRGRFGIPISDEEVAYAPLYKPEEDSPNVKYLQERRASLGGYLPHREVRAEPLQTPEEELFQEFFNGNVRPVSTTMAFVGILRKLLSHPELGKLIVPIVPDEARTFGMDGLFRQIGIYASRGQLYDPVDSEALLYYKEAQDGQILEEGITEAGGMGSFLAAGTAYATHGINTIPFFVYYSMFGMQRIGDLVWAGADMRTKGFLIGGTAGRTTLNGEGLQHQDGHSHVLASTVPTLKCYDPAFAYELAVIIREGIRRMYENQEDLFYYLTVENENYPMPALPGDEGVREGILKGMYRFHPADNPKATLQARLLGSGAIMNETLKARELLEEEYKIPTEVWSVTSYKELRQDGLETERWNLLHPEEEAKEAYVTHCLKDSDAVVVAASDYMKVLPDGIRPWAPDGMIALGTDGFGRSESRAALRDFFEVDYRFITFATLTALMRQGKVSLEVVKQAMIDLNIDMDKKNPMVS